MDQRGIVSRLALTLACDDYDYLRPLREGRVHAQGIDLNLLTVESGLRHHRMSRYGEYDACEYSMGSYIMARAQGIVSLQAIPFFARRLFCHGFCFVRPRTPVESPRRRDHDPVRRGTGNARPSARGRPALRGEHA